MVTQIQQYIACELYYQEPTHLLKWIHTHTHMDKHTHI